MLNQCSQRMYLMKLLQDQGLSNMNLNVIFQSVIISWLCYALSGWKGCLKSVQINHVNVFCNRYVRYYITTRLFNFQEMLIKQR